MHQNIRDRSGRSAMSTGLKLAGILAAVLTILSASGTASASAPITVSAPYTGSVYAGSDALAPILGTVCGGTSLGHHATWHRSSGTGGWAESAFERGGSFCSLPGANSSAEDNGASASSTLNVAVPIPGPATTGKYDVIINWTVDFTATWSIAHGRCPAAILTHGTGYEVCGVGAQFDMFSYTPLLLVDLTAGGIVYNAPQFYFSNGSAWSHDTSCRNNNGVVSCTVTSTTTGARAGAYSGHLLERSYFNGTRMNASHQYALEFYFEGDVFASLDGYPQPLNGTADAALNFASKGNGFSLNSVVIT